MEEKKFKRIVILWGVLLIVLQVINFITIATASDFLYLEMSKNIALMGSVIFLVISILFLVLTLKKKMAGPILGIIRGAFSILTLNIIDIIIGICLIVSCSNFIKYIKEDKGA